MDLKIFLALGAIALLMLGTTVADARKLGGGGGGGGHRMSAGPVGGGHAGRSSFRAGSSFKAGRFAGSNRSYARRSFSRRTGPVVGFDSDRRRHYRHYRRGSRIVIGYPYYYGGGYYSGYYSDCGWLYRKAIQTGSAYWWQRYQMCAG